MSRRVPTWAGADCASHDPELWFEDGSGPGMSYGAARAVAICWTCPIREACLTDALGWETGQRYGIRGGFLPAERAKMKRGGDRCPECGTPLEDQKRTYSAGEQTWAVGCRGCARRLQQTGSVEIVAEHRAGKSVLAIARDRALPYRTVHVIVQRAEQLREIG